jgi:ribosomal protein S27AE
MAKKNHCRDCKRCTSSFFGNLVGAPAHIVGGAVGGVTVNLFRRHCPQCGHIMVEHKKVAAGDKRFED